MKLQHAIRNLLLTIIMSTFVGTVFAQSDQQPLPNQAPLATPTAATTIQTPALVPSAPDLNVKAFVLMDANSGYIIAQKNADDVLPPASLTKLMTLYIIANELKHNQITMDDKVTISAQAWRTGGSKMFIKVGDQVNVSDLIQGIIVDSGNDATYAMAEYIGGTEGAFVSLMNQTAQTLGMTNSHFSDCNGLPTNDHHTSAHDLALLTRAFIQNFPEYYPWFQQKWFTYNHIKQPNRNRLLWRDPSVDGLKTGHTDAAGFCLISSALRDGTRLISVILGAPTDSARADDSEALLNYGFRFFESHKLYDADTPLTEQKVWYGRAGTVGLGLNSPLYVTILKDQYKNVKATVSVDELHAPIVKGQSYGKVTVMLGNQQIAEAPLVALVDDPTAGIFSRMFDHIAKLFHSWF